MDTTWSSQMEVALIGATGNAGSRILAELSRRGHHITAVARHPEKIAALSGITPLQADAGDVAGLAAAIKDHDAVVSSVHFTASDPHKLIAAVHQAGVPRYLVVGGEP
jgi:putative NADH-flavin reductase